MEQKHVTVQNGNYICDIDISVDEWKEILQDEIFMTTNYKDALLKFYKEPDHKSTCKALGEKYSISPQSLNGTITAFAKAVQKKMNRFEVIGTDGKPSYWIIPMQGKSLGELFEWTIRPELVEAIKNMLNISAKMKYFIGGYSWSGKSQFDRFVKDGIWENGYEEEKYSDLFSKISVGDMFALKSTFVKGQKPNLKSYLRIKQIGIVSQILSKSSIKIVWIKNDEFDLTNIKWYANTLEEITIEEDIQRIFGNTKKQLQMKTNIELLKSNKNLILTGAPGTGKTYLAKQIALSILFNKTSEDELSDNERIIYDNHFCFVQFHPSYDYTDFVEGLRAEELNGQVIFNLHNGTFKDFCKRAIQKGEQDNFDEVYENFLDDLSESEMQFGTPVHKKKFKVEINSNKSCVAIPLTDAGTRLSITKEMIRTYVIDNKILDWKPYLVPIGEYFKEKYPIHVTTKAINGYPYIFVVDEINRAEISKVFGELFFSIDPGYRGIKGKVKTQYANIQSGETIFDEELGQGWFYVPDNVYIIGTMNDIDRSVESMDFAMRRRFAWKEIDVEERKSMWNGKIDDWKDEASQRMSALNKTIEQIQGLSTAYHIGPAYFLKLENYNGNFNQLWNNHLKGILFEYLRGLPDANDQLDKLEAAYELQ
jgi:hypothetical protein